MKLTILLSSLVVSAAAATTRYQCTSPDFLECCQDFAAGALDLGTATGVGCSKPTDLKSAQGPGSCPPGLLVGCCGIGIVGSSTLPGEYGNCKNANPA